MGHYSVHYNKDHVSDYPGLLEMSLISSQGREKIESETTSLTGILRGVGSICQLQTKYIISVEL